jgi:hypothetical protein
MSTAPSLSRSIICEPHTIWWGKKPGRGLGLDVAAAGLLEQEVRLDRPEVEVEGAVGVGVAHRGAHAVGGQLQPGGGLGREAAAAIVGEEPVAALLGAEVIADVEVGRRVAREVHHPHREGVAPARIRAVPNRLGPDQVAIFVAPEQPFAVAAGLSARHQGEEVEIAVAIEVAGHGGAKDGEGLALGQELDALIGAVGVPDHLQTLTQQDQVALAVLPQVHRRHPRDRPGRRDGPGLAVEGAFNRYAESLDLHEAVAIAQHHCRLFDDEGVGVERLTEAPALLDPGGLPGGVTGHHAAVDPAGRRLPGRGLRHSVVFQHAGGAGDRLDVAAGHEGPQEVGGCAPH